MTRWARVHVLGAVPAPWRRNTNPGEPGGTLGSEAEELDQQVKRWREADHRQRWAGSALYWRTARSAA